MEVRKGYKQTEVGVIPEDWEVLPIGDLYDFQGGSQPPRHTFIFEEKAGYVRLLQIRDYKTDKYASYIPIPLAKRSCIPTDIMIGRYGPPIFQILNGMEGSYNVALMKAVPSSKIIQKYGWYLLKQNKLFEFVEKLSQRSSGQTGVDLNELRKYLIPLPPTKSEQTAIATALSDADALITSLEKLIEKKRAIKQGTMQKCLNPDFYDLCDDADLKPNQKNQTNQKNHSSDKWEVKKLGEIVDIVGGGTPSTFVSEYWNGAINWFTPTEIGLNKYTYESQRKLTKEGLSNCSARILPQYF
ncbi:MAG TPA: restriction endonuclease subunit S [Prolixibacteraceae bacterium]